MLSYSQAFQQLYEALQHPYDKQEAAAIAHRYMEDLSGLTYTQRLINKDEPMPREQETRLLNDKALLVSGKPLQQVLGYEWFMSRNYKVNEHVLIPRPETEELVQWIVDDNKSSNPGILDIGTGSGCIPISLKLAIHDANITACDVSTDALAVAQENANTLNADVSFRQLDFLNEAQRSTLPSFDIIVSNPPYIPEAEADTLHDNVKNHEPHLALFVPADDALLFYREIAMFGKTHLKQGGTIYCELHVDYALQTKQLFEEIGYDSVIVKEDMHGNLRMLKAQL